MIISELSSKAEKIIIKNFYFKPILFYSLILIEFIPIVMDLMIFATSIEKGNNLISSYEFDFKNDSIEKNAFIDVDTKNSSKPSENYTGNFFENFEFMSMSAILKKLQTSKSIKYYTLKDNNEKALNIFVYDNSLFFKVSAIIMLHFLSLSCLAYNKNKVNRTILKAISYQTKKQIFKAKLKAIALLSANFFQISFHAMGSFIFDLLFNIFLINFNLSFMVKYGQADYIITFLAFNILLFYSFIYLWYIANINIIFHFSRKIQIPYDNYLSKKYDLCLFFIKIVIAVVNNLSQITATNSFTPFVVKFFKLASFAVCLVLVCFLIIKLFTEKVIYLINKNINSLRIFNLFFLSLLFLSQLIFSWRYEMKILSIAPFCCIIMTSALFVFYFNEKNYYNIIQEKSVLIKLCFLLDIKILIPKHYKVENDDLIFDKGSHHNSTDKTVLEITSFHKKICKLESCHLKKTQGFTLHTILIAFSQLLEDKRHFFHEELTPNEESTLRTFFLHLIKISNTSNLHKKLILIFPIAMKISFLKKNKKIFIMLEILIEEFKNAIKQSNNNNCINYFPGININSASSKYSQIDRNDTSSSVGKKNNKRILNLNEADKNIISIISKKIINFKIVKIYNASFKILESACEIFIKLITNLNSKRYDTLFSDCQILIKKRNKIKKLYFLINKYKSSFRDSLYACFFIKFIFKKLFKENLFCENEISLPCDVKSLVAYHYSNDNFINLIFEDDAIIVNNASKEFVDYVGKDFKLIFPEFCRDHQIIKFENLIKESNGNNFNCKILFELKSKNLIVSELKSFNLECLILPDFSLSQLLIIIKCNEISGEILVLEENLVEKSGVLKRCSAGISSILCINNNFLDFKNTIEFEIWDYFIENSINQNLIHPNTDEQKEFSYMSNYNITGDKPIEVESKSYYLNYKNFSRYFLDFYAFLKKREMISEVDYFESLKYFNQQKIKQILLKIESIERLKYEHIVCYVISIKFLDLPNRFSLKNETTSVPQLKEDIDNKQNLKTNDDFDYTHPGEYKSQINENFIKEKKLMKKLSNEPQNHLNSLILSNNINKMQKNKTSTTASTSYGETGENKALLNTKKFKHKLTFIKSIIFIILILIIFWLTVVVIAIDKINEIKYFFRMINNFNALILNYYDITLSLHQKIDIIKDKNNLSSEYSIFPEEYYYANTFYSKGVTLNISEYMSNEIFSKYDYLRALIDGIQREFFMLRYENLLHKFLNFNMTNLFVTIQNSSIKVRKREMSFFESLDLFLTTAKIIAENPRFYTSIYIIDNSKDFFDFKNFKNNSLDYYQISAINLIINFEQMSKSFEFFLENLYQLFEERIKYLSHLTVFSQVFLLVFQQTLLLIIFLLIKYFKYIMLLNTIQMEKLIEDEKCQNIILKLKVLKKTTLVYKEHPCSIFENLKKIQRSSKLLSFHRFNKQKPTDDKTLTLFFNKNWKASKTNRMSINQEKIRNPFVIYFIENSALIQSFRKIIFSSSLFFFFYFVFLYLIFGFTEKESNEINDIAKKFLSLGEKITKNAVLINTMIMTNQTEASIINWSSQPNKVVFDYTYSINNFYTEINNLEKKVKFNSHKEHLIKYFYDYIDCNIIYSENYSDVIINQTSGIYSRSNFSISFVNNNLKKICKQFDFTHHKNFFFILENLNQLNRYTFNKFSDIERSYEKLTTLHQSAELFEFFFIVLLIVRPIYNYINNSLIIGFITSDFSDYITFTILNLSFNFIVECLFFYLINKFILKKMRKLDKDIKNVLNILRV